MSGIKSWLVRTFKVGYSQVALEDNSDDELANGAPIPTCTVPDCYEEMHTKGGIMYSFCKNHYLMHKGDLDIYRVCKNPSCNVTITTPGSKFCFEHS